MLNTALSHHTQRYGTSVRYWLIVAMAMTGFDTTMVQGRLDIPDNLATGKEAYMVRLTDSLPPASNGNDGDGDTVVRSTDKTVDAYWEVDLDQEYAVTSVHVYAASGFEQRMTHATVRLYDENHDSVFSQKLDHNAHSIFEINCGGPRRARYVRVGFEYKEHSSPDDSWEWYLGLKDVAVFGGPASDVGLLMFGASTNESSAGQSVTLNWEVDSVSDLFIYPDVGYVGIATDPSGNGSTTVTPDTSTEYVLVADSTFDQFIQGATVIVDGQPLPIRINEFVAQNQLSLKDGYNNDPDWIELYNPGNAPVNLVGYGLSDDPSRLTKWTFPDVNIPAHGTLIVFASGNKQVIDPDGYVHADWRLSSDGESVVLTAPDGQTIVDQILDYPAQREDLAYGRDMLGRLRFLEPTPNSVNLTTSYEGWLAPLVFSHERGFYENGFNLSIDHPDPDGDITLSQDGDSPSTTYSHAFPVTTTRTVRASVTKPDYKSPRIQTHTYLFIDDIATSSVMRTSIAQDSRYRDRLRDGLLEIPTLAIVVPSRPDDWREQEASVELIWPERLLTKQADCGMLRFGGAWAVNKFPKMSYRLKFRKEYGTPKFKAPLFADVDHGFAPEDSFDELDLHSGSQDMYQRGFYMAASFVESSMLDMGSLNPHGRFMHVYINGDYWGQYYVRERLVEHMLADYLGGEPEDYMNVRGNDNVGNDFVPGCPDPMGRHTWEYVRDNRDSYQTIRHYVDVPNLIDFMVLWCYGNCESEYRAAGPKAEGSGYKFWIADADGFLRNTSSNKTNRSGPGGLFGALASERDPDFLTLMADRIYKHLKNDGALTPDRNTERLETRMTEIENSLIGECARWGYQTPSNWVSGANNIINSMFQSRTNQLLGHYRSRNLYPSFDPPQYNQQGGSIDAGFSLTMSASTGTIYYTIDGNDPRLPGGGISPEALTYESSGSSSSQTLIVAGSTWRYWNQGTEPSGSWRVHGYNDTSWAAGRAQLGYGDGDEVTRIGYGPNSSDKYISYYFRHAFTVNDPTSITQLTIQIIRDDGAVVYLNGAELVRDNMPTGNISYATTSAATVGGDEEDQWFTFDVSPEQLTAGTNVLAVEVHQTSGTSTDLSFDLSLVAQGSAQGGNQDPLVLNEDTIVKSRVRVGQQWSALNEAFFDVTE